MGPLCPCPNSKKPSKNKMHILDVIPKSATGVQVILLDCKLPGSGPS
ncbi:unnamed protein product [Staurois parvus]|uniref:Uncharacterized protein n=1 Tax=Staurois parvus TaxID=386267 RepID=A0ABN9HC94_9NEOB|nr:unnamed protein product [Staurois parvus]